MHDTEAKPQTTLIVGPGAMGRLLAFHLSSHSCSHRYSHSPSQRPVLLAGRRQLSEHHTLIAPDGEMRQKKLRSCVVSQLNHQDVGKIETVHLTTKAYATQTALDSISRGSPNGPVSPGTVLVLWQNGFTVQPAITDSWPGPVLCASTTEGAYINDKETTHCVVHAGHGHTVIGDLNNQHSELAGRVAQRLDAAGMSAEPVADIRVRLWHKLAVNAAINPLVARYRIRNGQLRDRPFRPMVMALIDEIQAIAQAESIAPPPAGWAELVWTVITATANNRASMLQDVLANRPTEHAAILGPLCNAAQRHTIEAPQLNALHKWLSSR